MGMTPKHGRKWLLALALAGGLAGFAATVTAEQEALPWKDENFQGQFFEADIKAVLRQILKQNGLDVIFRPEVTGEVTMEFEKTPLKGAFSRIMNEYQLDFTYDPASKSITVFKTEKLAGGSTFTVPKNVDPSAILKTLKEFELLGPDIKVHTDAATNALFFRGPSQKISEIKKIVEELDKAYFERSDNYTKLEKARLDLQMNAATLAASQKRMQEGDTDSLLLEVRKLKFANVGQTTVSFQGQQVSVPGIVDSLRAFIGQVTVKSEDDKKGGAPAGAAQQQAGQAGQAGAEAGNRKVYPIVDVDVRTNSVIIQGTRPQVEKVLAVLDKLDQPVPLVEVDMMILKGTSGLTQKLAMQYSMMGNRGAADTKLDVGGTTSPVAQSFDPADAGNNWFANRTHDTLGFAFTGDAASSGLGYLLRGPKANLQAYLNNFLKSDNKTQTIASPKVITLNNRAAKVSNTNNVSISTNTQLGGQSTLQTVAAGTTLNITPSVIEDPASNGLKLVRLELSVTSTVPKIGNIGGATTITTDGQDVQTSLLIPDGSTYLLGGLFNDDRTELEVGVPLLMDIPLFGHLFKNTESGNTKGETVFLITPSVHDYEEIIKPKKHWARSYLDSQKDILDREQRAMLPEGWTSKRLRQQEDE